ncbi:MAG: polyprenyl synthetase family protein, partial [Lachnospiraceae bacterium]|nr:polyprenyl synthetase family protein [Lachnospiraceae bacterium]
IEAEEQQTPLQTKQLLFIHEHKTAALIQAAMMIGAILAGAGQEDIQRLEKCAYNIGIAFQIQDDILDVIGDSQELGKQVGSDEQNHKQTYVTIHGLEKSKQDVETLSREAVDILQSFENRNDFLEALILDLIHRRK